MSKKERIEAGGMQSPFYSDAVRYGNTLYVSGQVGVDSSGELAEGIQAQTALALENAKRIVEAAGGSMDNVLICHCFLRRPEDFAGMNEAYSKYLGGGHNIAPARYTVLAPPVDARILIEISMIVGL